MSWGYWGIVIGLSAMVVMLIACIRLLSFDRNEDVPSLEKAGDGLVERNPDPPIIRRRAA